MKGHAMNALQQYIDLYRDHGRLLREKSCETLNAPREKACTDLQNMALPRKGSENYEHTDLQELLAPDYALNIARVPLGVNPQATFRCDVPNLSTSLFMLLNDGWAETDISRRNLPEGVTVDSLAHAAATMPELVGKYYNKLADPANPLAALNTMLAQDGLFLHIRKGVKLEKPLQLVDILQYDVPLMTVRRMLIVIEDAAEGKLLICDHTQNPDVKLLNLQTIEIFAGRNSHFDLYDLEESTENTTRLSTLFLRQESGSNVLIDGITLFNGTTRNEYFCSMPEPDAELHLYGMGIEDLSRRLDTYSRISHEAERCRSHELFKYVVDDSSTGAFSGRIYVAPGAQKTEAYQANRNIVGTDDARMFSKPQLEIYADDVKCSHGTAIGQLDALQVFYMRTRGLSESTARMLLKQAFMADVIEGVRLPALKDRLRQLVEMRFSGTQGSCSACHNEGCRI